MEETVWLFFSVLAVIIALGAISALVMNNKEDIAFQASLRGLDRIQSQCNYVCQSSVGTSLPADIPLKSGSVLYTEDGKICVDYGESVRCRLCECEVADYNLNLSTEFAEDALEEHTYSCYVTREKDGVSIECQG